MRRYKVGGRKVRATPLTWKRAGYLYFAHGPEGMYIIEQRRGRFYATLDLGPTAHREGREQIMGDYPSLKKAMTGVGRDHKALSQLEHG